MHVDEISRLYLQFREPGFGTLSVDELTQVQSVIAAERPRSFVEIGTASGLSTGMIARMLEEHGGERLVTVDLSDRFFADDTRETGFVIPALYPGGIGGVDVERRTGAVSAGLVGGERFDLALVDAGHAHPWPLLDTLCVNLVLDGSRTVLHHDLTLFRRQGNGRGAGPKFLFDQFPESHRRQFGGAGGNLFSLSLDLPAERLEQIAIDCLFLPWTLNRKIAPEAVAVLQDVFSTHYSPALATAFAKACSFFNQPNGRFWRPPARA